MSSTSAQSALLPRKYLTLIIGTLIFLVLVAYLVKGCNGAIVADAVPVKHESMQTASETNAKPTQDPIKVTLVNGVVLDAYKGGMEDLMVSFLNDSSAKAGKDVWFDFNELNFNFGTAEILPESKPQLNNIIQILNAYPAVKVKIGAYTDKVGNEAANVKLSQARANATDSVLKAAGLAAQLTGAEGYGSSFAKYEASAPDAERVHDRRVSLNVRSK